MGNNRRTGRFATAQDARWTAITAAYRADEATVVQRLCGQTQLPARTAARIQAQACKLIDGIRATPGSHHVLDALLTEYDLDNVEGIALMCLAEALIRVPDAATADALISDKIATADWAAHVGHSDSLLANAATWGLLLGGRLLRRGEGSDEHLPNALRRLLARSGEPIIRSAVRQAMRLVGGHFVFAADIDAAIARAGADRQRRYSFDMLGEAARTAEDADAYFQRYLEALLRLADSEANRPWRDSNGISVKLSALHPRFDYRHGERVIAQVTERLLALARAARDADIGVTVDAEEAEVLQLSLRVFERVYRNPALVGWDGLGLAVQAYGKRALPVIDWLAALAADGARAIPVRLVKGAYWDREIKYSQQLGLADYPVFTRKRHTDVSFLACARRLLEHGQTLFPQFATHNAWSLAAIAALAPAGDFEFQRLHGMGEALYAQVVDDKGPPPRVYAPVGDHRTLLPYLIRRLLENGANTSFVNQIANPDMPAQALARDPVATVAGHAIGRHPAIPVPRHLYGEQRPNPVGVDFSDEHARARFGAQLQESEAQAVCAEPVIDCEPRTAGTAQPLRNPADTAQFVGSVRAATS
ncbi:MAG: proline dehydrogenase family protein [Salinisphaera sp.]|nr:proline dehydrogenase family protein [Salinisphaera sp.]